MNRPRNLTEQAFLEFFDQNDPAKSKGSTTELSAIRKAIEEKGEWHEWEEWRISTNFELRIHTVDIGGESWFHVSVECDRQVFSCKCPTLERAFMFSLLYRHIIIYQFYSVGPPWASPRSEP